MPQKPAPFKANTVVIHFLHDLSNGSALSSIMHPNTQVLQRKVYRVGGIERV